MKQVCQIIRTTTRKGETTTEVAYGITSVGRDRANAPALRNWNRGHWEIENRIHWVRDEQPRLPTDEGGRPLPRANGFCSSGFGRSEKFSNQRVAHPQNRQHRSSFTRKRLESPTSIRHAGQTHSMSSPALPRRRGLATHFTSSMLIVSLIRAGVRSQSPVRRFAYDPFGVC